MAAAGHPFVSCTGNLPAFSLLGQVISHALNELLGILEIHSLLPICKQLEVLCRGISEHEGSASGDLKRSHDMPITIRASNEIDGYFGPRQS